MDLVCGSHHTGDDQTCPATAAQHFPGCMPFTSEVTLVQCLRPGRQLPGPLPMFGTPSACKLLLPDPVAKGNTPLLKAEGTSLHAPAGKGGAHHRTRQHWEGAGEAPAALWGNSCRHCTDSSGGRAQHVRCVSADLTCAASYRCALQMPDAQR